MKFCPECGQGNDDAAPFCQGCGARLDSYMAPGEVQHGIRREPLPRYTPVPQSTDSNAVASLVLGIIGVLVCGIILGPLAIYFGNKAQWDIRASRGALGGEGMAKAGIVLGWVAIGLFFLTLGVTLMVRL